MGHSLLYLAQDFLLKLYQLNNILWDFLPFENAGQRSTFSIKTRLRLLN